ncbi:MAG: hypothetical protein IT249_17730 [Chitinophagaceae bacterium]|nr:hypothetical protein [Chitinophagaceae bacterium]
MKKNICMLTLLMFFSLVVKLSIGQVDSGCKGTSNFVIEKTEADKMKLNFKNIYVKKNPRDLNNALDQRGWIDTNVVNSMMNLFQAESNIDGFRIYFCSALKKDPIRFQGQSRQKKVSFIIVPTSYDRTANPDSESIHKNEWEKKLVFDYLPETGNVIINMKKEDAFARIDFFRSEQRKEDTPRPIDSLSISVWFSYCCIEEIAGYIKTHHSVGLSFYPAAYYKQMPGHQSQKQKNQSTLIIVPSRATTDGWEDDYDVYKFYKKNQALLLSAYNHGELCPIKCPKPGN